MIFPTFAGKGRVWSNARKAVRLLGAAIALFAICLPLFSQGSQGTIQGGVFDQSGGAIAGATVAVTDVARGVTRSLTTDGAGEYVATTLNPGTYTVRAEAKGFRAVEHTGVLVEVGQNIRVDVVLQPGEQTQTITVTGEVPSVNTTDATLGGTVSNDSINSLPLNGRNFQRLLQLRPGVVNPVGAGAGSGQSTNGRRGGDDDLLVEGLVSFAQLAGGSSILSVPYRAGDSGSLLPLDSIQEFNTEQNPKAEYGWRQGSVVNVGIKSGTNSLHGTAYAFGRDASATDAGNYFSTPGISPVTPATLEQFGATAGGRIIKDKIFWFVGYDGLRDTLGDVTVATIPSDVAGPGPKLSMVDACKALGAAKISANSARIAGLANTYNLPTTDPNYCQVQPANPVAGGNENLFPFNPSTSNSFSPGLISTGPLNNGLFKGDYILGPHHHISGTYFVSKSSQLVNSSAAQLTQEWMSLVTENIQMWGGNWTWTPNSTWVSEFRLGYTYDHNLTDVGDVAKFAPDPWPAGYSFPTGVTIPAGTFPSQGKGFPITTIAGFTGQLGSGINTSVRGPEGNVDLVENVSYLHGKHAFKFGFEYIDNVFDQNNYSLAMGSAKFAASGATTALENFLQGVTNGGTILVGSPAINYRARWYAGFFQDDWRVTNRITLNMGLRYEIQRAPVERDNNTGTFNPNANPATTFAIQQTGPGVPLWRADRLGFGPRFGVAWDVRGNGKTVVRAGANLIRDYVPVGIIVAFIPFGANVPAIGLNTSGTAANLHTNAQLSLTPSQINWNSPTAIFPNVTTPVTINQATYTGTSCTYVGEPGLPAGYVPTPCNFGTFAPMYRLPSAAEFQLDVQRAVTNNLTVDVAYVGNRGFKELSWSDLNQPPLGTGWNTPWTATQLTAFNATQTAANQIPLTNAGLTSAQICVNTNGATCKANSAAEIAARPYNTQFPYLGNIIEAQNNAHSAYDALQVTVSERASHGLSFLAGYTFAHALDESNQGTQTNLPLPANLTNTALEYGNSTNDIRHRFTFAPTYLIPGMKFPGQMLQGWSLSGILTLQGGPPWWAYDATSNDLLGTGEFNNGPQIKGADQTWNYSGPRSAFNSGPTPIPCFGTMAGCTAFASAPAATQAACQSAAQAPYAGNAQLQSLALAALTTFGCYVQGGGILTPPAFGMIGNEGRDAFRSPAYYNVDLSVGKLWKFSERYSAQFRLEFFNLFNRADFTSLNAFNLSSTDPSKGVTGNFGCSCSTPDSSNPVLGSGGPRHIQFGLKLTF